MGTLDQSKPEIYVMVDVETSGPIPADFSLLSLGAVIVGQHTPPFHKYFYTELQPLPFAMVEQEAMNVNKLDIERLKVVGDAPAEAMQKFREWVMGVAPVTHVRPVMVSMGTFDYMWVQWYFHHFKVRSPFPVNTLDMKSMYFGKKNVRWSQTTGSSILAKHPEWRSAFQHTHNALDDAIQQAELFHRMLNSPASS